MEINCSKDPIDALKQMFVNMSMGTRIKAGQCPVRRSVFLKPHIDKQRQPEYGENRSYNPWRTTADHQLAGSINDARRGIYKVSADLRRFKNRVSDTEPISSRNLNQPQ